MELVWEQQGYREWEHICNQAEEDEQIERGEKEKDPEPDVDLKDVADYYEEQAKQHEYRIKRHSRSNTIFLHGK
jgi:hypothetical protein